MLRPVLPLYEYYSNYDYITQKLCENRNRTFLKCNGSCYVQKLMKEDDLLIQDIDTEQTEPIITIYFPIFIIEKSDYYLKNIILFKDLEKPFFSKLFIAYEFTHTIFHPPKIS